MSTSPTVPESAALAIPETVSEIKPKAKRGRPKTVHRIHADMLGNAGADGCARTKLNFSLTVTLLSVINKSTPEQQSRLIGCTYEEMRTKWGGKLFPGAFKAGPEIARYLDHIGDTQESRAKVLEIMLDARGKNIPWNDITAHFRNLRLGEKQGNALSLFAHLARAYDEYIRNFPATTQAARMGGVRNLIEAIEPITETVS